MNNEEFVVPVDLAIDIDKLYNSAAADEWYNGPDDLEEYGLCEDCHGYNIVDNP